MNLLVLFNKVFLTISVLDAEKKLSDGASVSAPIVPVWHHIENYYPYQIRIRNTY